MLALLCISAFLNVVLILLLLDALDKLDGAREAIDILLGKN